MKGISGTCWPALLSLLIAACAGAQHAATPVAIIDPSFFINDLSRLNGLDGTIRRVIRSEAEWKDFWLAQQLPAYALSPTGLDFSRHMVLLVGPDIAGKIVATRIDHVSIERDTIVAYVDLATGRPDSLNTAPCAIIPVHAVVIPRADLPVRFVEPDRPRGC
jgi:hypothetical protein